METQTKQTQQENLERIIQNAICTITSKVDALRNYDQHEVFTVTQAAEFLHLSPSTIYTYISKRSIPFVKRNGSVWLLRSRLMEWLREGEKQTFNNLSR